MWKVFHLSNVMCNKEITPRCKKSKCTSVFVMFVNWCIKTLPIWSQAIKIVQARVHPMIFNISETAIKRMIKFMPLSPAAGYRSSKKHTFFAQLPRLRKHKTLIGGKLQTLPKLYFFMVPLPSFLPDTRNKFNCWLLRHSWKYLLSAVPTEMNFEFFLNF